MKKACDQNLTHSLDTPKGFPVKSVPEVVIRDVCDTWHGLNTVNSIQSIQKSTRHSQEFGKKMTINAIVQNDPASRSNNFCLIMRIF